MSFVNVPIFLYNLFIVVILPVHFMKYVHVLQQSTFLCAFCNVIRNTLRVLLQPLLQPLATLLCILCLAGYDYDDEEVVDDAQDVRLRPGPLNLLFIVFPWMPDFMYIKNGIKFLNQNNHSQKRGL